MSKVVKLLIAVTALCSSVQSAKVLVFICQKAKSHQLVFHPVIKELAVRGHEVDYYTHHPIANPPKTLNQIRFPMEDQKELMKVVENMDWTRSILPQFQIGITGRSFRFSGISNECYQSSLIRDLLASNKTYDMVIGEFYMMQEDFSVLIHKFNALGVSILSVPDSHELNEFSGLPSNPSYMIPFASGSSDDMTFSERLINFVDIALSTIWDYYYLIYPLQDFVDEHFTYEGWETRPPLTRIASDMALILSSSHHSLGYAYPSAPHVKQILGTNVDYSPPRLPSDIQEFMDRAEHGIVYFSLGSIATVKFLQLKNGYEPLLKILSNLKQKVLWKWSSTDESPPQVSNIKFSEWFPQQSILAHNNTKLFITHGGLGSLTEAVFHGVPLIVMPVFGDQQKNAKLITTLNIGVQLDLNNLTETSVKWATNEVLNDPKFKEEALKRSAIFRDRPMKPVDEAMYWIEYVLRYGKVLQPAAAHMPYYQLYLLDVIGFLAVSAILVVYVLSYLIRKSLRVVISKISSKTNTKTSKSNIQRLDSKKRK